MKILIAGGAGFIGAHVTARLLKEHEVILAVRNVAAAKRRFPDAKVLACDFVKNTDINCWLQRLQGVDAVINCVGVLNTLRSKEINAIHYEAPRAMFRACEQLGIKHVLHISAMGIDVKTPIAYAATKKNLEEELLASKASITLVRPSFVYSSTGYGGSSLFRALAAFPFFIPLTGSGATRFQPIHAEDLAEMIAILITKVPEKTEIIYAAGPEVVTLKELLQKLRAWLGLAPAPFVKMPFILLKCLAPLGNIFSWIPVNSTTVGMMQASDFVITGSEAPHDAAKLTGVTPRSLQQDLQRHPSGTQDLWSAKLYFLNPLVRIVLAFLWVFSGVIGLLSSGQSSLLLVNAGIPSAWQSFALWGSCGFDILLGLWIFSGFVRRVANYLQLAMVFFYTLVISITMPALWLEPFAPIAKNLPVLICILLLMVLGRER